ncbi:hypothetical protein [Campylobacter avium]|uniref:hypothetical protein n=1 Tax=Campylobacter avium TaxID=522485 RepID=UPI00248B7283|nr:hypothetical protein [Campylobacter avium]
MKIKELDFFDEDIRQEFCTYLKKYFKEDCEVKWVFNDRILIDINFEVTKEPAYLSISDRDIYKICLNELKTNIPILDFKKYIDKFLNKEYKKKDYINTKDFKKICALYDSLDFKYKKDDVKEFYNAIASVLSKDYEPYILDNKKIFTRFNKVYSEQGIYSDNECLTFTVHVHGVNYESSFEVCLKPEQFRQTNILTLAEDLVNIQKKLEDLVK